MSNQQQLGIKGSEEEKEKKINRGEFLNNWSHVSKLVNSKLSKLNPCVSGPSYNNWNSFISRDGIDCPQICLSRVVLMVKMILSGISPP